MSSARLILRIFSLFVIIGGITLAIAYRDKFDAVRPEHWVPDVGLAGTHLFFISSG